MPDLRPRKKNRDYHFHFSEGQNESTDFHDPIGKAECFGVSICGNGDNNLCSLTHREDKERSFCVVTATECFLEAHGRQNT